MIFDCGNCNRRFSSTWEEQRLHDQDAGYGICSECEEFAAENVQKQLDQLRLKVADALNSTNCRKFLAMSGDMQDALMIRLVERGVISWMIAH